MVFRQSLKRLEQSLHVSKREKDGERYEFTINTFVSTKE